VSSCVFFVDRIVGYVSARRSCVYPPVSRFCFFSPFISSFPILALPTIVFQCATVFFFHHTTEKNAVLLLLRPPMPLAFALSILFRIYTSIHGSYSSTGDPSPLKAASRVLEQHARMIP
jgi:hypothetical protein